MYVPLPVTTRNTTKIKTSRNPLKFPNLLTFSDSLFIPVSGAFEFILRRPVIMFIPSVSHP